MLKLKLQSFGHLMRRTDSLEKTLMLGKIEGRRRRGWERMRWLDGMTDSMAMSEQALGIGDVQGSLVCCSPWGHKESDPSERLNWTAGSSAESGQCSSQLDFWNSLCEEAETLGRKTRISCHLWGWGQQVVGSLHESSFLKPFNGPEHSLFPPESLSRGDLTACLQELSRAQRQGSVPLDSCHWILSDSFLTPWTIAL